MSILIRGMEMPTSCIACFLNFGEKRPEYGLTIYCPYSDGVISWRDKAFDNVRLASCGITPVPTPHGKLIDVDIILAQLREMSLDDLSLAEDLIEHGIDDVLDDAPTIIERED